MKGIPPLTCFQCPSHVDAWVYVHSHYCLSGDTIKQVIQSAFNLSNAMSSSTALIELLTQCS